MLRVRWLKLGCLSLCFCEPKSLENTAVLVPQPTKIPGKYSSFVSTADRNLWKIHQSGLVPRQNPWKVQQFWFHSRPKSLETHIEKRNQNPWNTTQSLGLSLHLSTRLLHWMWAQGWHLASWLKRGNYFLKLSWNQFLISKKLRYAKFSFRP